MSDTKPVPGQTPTGAAALRKRAEEQAGVMDVPSAANQTPEEAQRLLHELRVHQIELEMQNEELRVAQAALGESRERYFDLYDLAPVGYCTLSEPGLILEANLTAATLLGLTRSVLVKQPFSRFILKADQDIYYLHRKRLFESYSASAGPAGEPQECELRLVKPDGALFWAHLMGTAAQAEDGAPVCRVVFNDITERKRAEKALRITLAKYQTLFDSFPLGITVSDKVGNILETNPMAEQLLGVPQEDHTQRGIDGPEWQTIRPDGTPMPPGEYASVRALKEQRLVENEEAGIVKPDGATTWISVTAAPLPLEGYGVVVTYGDITARKQAEQALAHQNEALIKLNHFSIDLSMLPLEEDLEGLIARQIKEIAAAEVAIFSEYNPANRTTTPQHIEMKPGLLDKVVHLLGTQVKNIHSVVSDEMYREMTTDIIGVRRTLSEAAFGAIPRPIGAAIQALLKVDRFIGIAYLIEGKLYGTTLLGMSKDQPDPPRIILENYIFLAASALRRKQAEEALRESEERLRLTTDNMVDLIAQFDAQAFFQYVSPSYEKILGYRAEDLVGKSAVDFLHPDERDEIIQAIDAMLRLGAGAIQFRYRHKDGSYRWIESTGRNLLNADGQVIGSTMGSRDITARKQAEDALRKSADLIEKTLFSLLDAVFIIDAETVEIVDCNPAASAIFGYSRQEMLGQTTMFLHVNQASLEEFRQHLNSDMEAAKDFMFLPEFKMKRKDGTVFISEHSVVPLKNKQGRCTGWVSVVRDITERKRAEEALRVALEAANQSRRALLSVIEDHRRTEGALAVERSLLRTLVDHLPDAVYVKDAAGHKTLSNPADFHNMGAVSEAEVLGKTDFDLFPLDLAEAFYADDQRVIQSGQPVLNREEGITRSDGTRGWQLTSKAPVRDSAGQVICLVGVGHDITDRKQAEEMLRWAGQRYRSLFEEAPLMYIITRNQESVPIIADCNRAFTDTLGYARDEVIGRPLADFYTPEARAALLEGGYQQAMGDGVGVEERRLVARDGHVIEAILTALPETDTQGNVTGTRAMYVDITARKQAEEIIKAYSEKLEQRVAERTHSLEEAQERLLRHEQLAVLGQIAGGIAHELRTPLGAIKNSIYLLNLILDAPEATVKEALEIMNREINTSDRIINSLLGFTRPRQPARHIVDVRWVIEQALSRVDVPPQVQLKQEIDEKLPIILADAGQLEQVFGNLILNAVQAMPEGGRLTIQAQQAPALPVSVGVGFMPKLPDTGVDGWIVVSIADAGTGITQEHLVHLFEPLFTTKSKGMGMGLPLVKLLTEANGGGIEVQSEPGKGSTFSVYLPIGKAFLS